MFYQDQDHLLISPNISSSSMNKFQKVRCRIRGEQRINLIMPKSEGLKSINACDALTGLSNRDSFLNHLQQKLQNHRNDMVLNSPETRGEIAVLLLDVDHFYLINQSLGNLAGNRLLKAIAYRLNKCIGTEHFLARLGGDEFAIFLNNVPDISYAQKIAERIQAILSFPLTMNGHNIYISVSIGIACSQFSSPQADELLYNAEAAMYRAKTIARGSYVVFEQTMHTFALSRFQMMGDLRQAISQLVVDRSTCQFQLYYQPIVSLTTGSIEGFEALIRWFHPVYGQIPPSEFIPLAEETGLIIPIGQWVLQQACRQLRAWQQQADFRPLTMNVNVSSLQFLQPGFVSTVKEVLHSTQILPSDLKLEITESAPMSNMPSVLSQLQQIHELGVKISLDDFGTGFSSLSCLQNFPVHTLKIDRSFVSMLGKNRDSMVQTIINLAHGLNMEIVAEGIESLQQLNQLNAFGCKLGQGYLFSAPIPPEIADVWLAYPDEWMVMQQRLRS